MSKDTAPDKSPSSASQRSGSGQPSGSQQGQPKGSRKASERPSMGTSDQSFYKPHPGSETEPTPSKSTPGSMSLMPKERLTSAAKAWSASPLGTYQQWMVEILDAVESGPLQDNELWLDDDESCIPRLYTDFLEGQLAPEPDDYIELLHDHVTDYLRQQFKHYDLDFDTDNSEDWDVDPMALSYPAEEDGWDEAWDIEDEGPIP